MKTTRIALHLSAAFLFAASTAFAQEQAAPADSNNVSSTIITSWVSRRGTMGNVDAWMKANADNRAWNACAIVKGEKYLYFDRRRFGRHKVISVDKGDW